MPHLSLKELSTFPLKEDTDPNDLGHFPAKAGFTDATAAYRCLKRIAQLPEIRPVLAKILPHLLHTLADTANPNRILVNFERFVQNAPAPIDLFHDFSRTPRSLEILILLFEGSQFLTEILLRHPHYFARLTAHYRLAQQKSAAHLQTEAQAKIAPLLDQKNQTDPLSLLNALRRFQRWELLRIGASDLFDTYDLTTVTAQLSYVADSLIAAALTTAALPP